MSIPVIRGLEVLQQRTLTKMLYQAFTVYGVKEIQGVASNPSILAMAKETGIPYSDDSVPWCGLFMAWVAFNTGKPSINSPLWALNWSKWGNNSPTPCFGDVLVFRRTLPDGKIAGHVGLYIAEDSYNFYVLGGNQNDSVCISKIPRKRLVAARNFYKSRPESAEPVYVLGVDLTQTKEQ